MSSRTRARQTLLKLLYLAESRELSFEEALREMESHDRLLAVAADAGEARELIPFAGRLDEKDRAYVEELGRTIQYTRDEMNAVIAPLLRNWDFSRIARIDRLILWIALAELRTRPDIPRAVAINEAVELAKRFSSQKNAGFINGVLDAAARSMAE